MKKKSAFTLVELLIVIVIIGILSSSILPKISGYLARTRDLQRKMDLTALASAIETYKSQSGQFPTRGSPDTRGNSWGGIYFKGCYQKSFFDSLAPYLTKAPSDPQKNSIIKIHHQAEHKIGGYANLWGKDYEGGCAWQPGQYVFQVMRKGTEGRNAAAVLVAKVETPDFANYVLFSKEKTLIGGLWDIYVYRTVNGFVVGKYGPNIDDLKLCSSVERGSPARWELQSDGTYKCFYADQKQLYYIVKIE